MAAPKGNKYALGNSGKMRRFLSPEDLKEGIDDYFNFCDNHKVVVGIDKKGLSIEEAMPIPYSISGLCVHLDIDRRTLLNYEQSDGYEEYFHIVKMAKEKISAYLIARGIQEGKRNNSALTIFLLKNQGYSDKQEVEHSGEIAQEINIKVGFGE